jgi:hypothetical protein
MKRYVRLHPEFFESEEDRIRRKQSTCEHMRYKKIRIDPVHWHKRCTVCGFIADSDHLHERKKVKEVVLFP